MLDETLILETPPLYGCYGRIGEQVCVPVTGSHARRVLHGALNVGSGEVLLLITDEWVQETHQYFLGMLRAHWRGWRIVLFEDRGSPHLAEDSLEMAKTLNIEVRLLPTATPQLNAMDHLWRHVKGEVLADPDQLVPLTGRSTRSVSIFAHSGRMNACRKPGSSPATSG